MYTLQPYLHVTYIRNTHKSFQPENNPYNMPIVTVETYNIISIQCK